jgi:hypothetical protein
MLLVKNTLNRHTSFILNVTNNCSWWLNDLALRYNINLQYCFLPLFIVTFDLQQYNETLE